jgi:hypothetical protein
MRIWLATSLLTPTLCVTTGLVLFSLAAASYAGDRKWVNATCLQKQIKESCRAVETVDAIQGGSSTTGFYCPSGMTLKIVSPKAICIRETTPLTERCVVDALGNCADDAVAEIEQRVRAEVLCTQMLRLHAIAPEPGFPAWNLPPLDAGALDVKKPRLTGWPREKSIWEWQLGFDDKRKAIIEIAAEGNDSGLPVCGTRSERLILREPDGAKRCGTIRGPARLTLERDEQQVEGQLLFQGNIIWWSDGQFWSLPASREKVATTGAGAWGNSYVLFSAPKATACLVRQGPALGVVGTDRQLSTAQLSDDKYITVGDKVPAGVVTAEGSVILWDNGSWWKR